MNQAEEILHRPLVLMEGALGERLKRDYGLNTNGIAGMSHLIYETGGSEALREIWNTYIDVARRYQLPLIATTPTRRANCQSLAAAGLSHQAITDNVRLLASVRDASGIPMLAGGMMGCSGNAYTGEGCLSFTQARELHRWTAQQYEAAHADFIFAALIPTLPEALGLAHAIAETPLPYLISLTIREDGRLIDGTPIAEAIEAVDASAPRKPVFYMSNCVHPRILHAALCQPINQRPSVRERFLGLQANTADMPYHLLDASPVLYTSSPEALAEGMLALKQDFGFRLFGGCCGTDARHLDAIASAITQNAIA